MLNFAKPSILKCVYLLSCCLLISPQLSAYELAQARGKLVSSKNVEVLEQISEGISDISQEASKAIAFISVSKMLSSNPYGEFDPFDFFFGPRFRAPNPREEKRQQSGVGSGFIIDLKKGYIITNNHVIQGADEISVKLANEESYTAKVLGSDANTDVAVIQITDEKFKRSGLSQLYLDDSEKAQVGQFVLALGAPFGLETSLSFGIISAKGRGNLNITNLGNFLQTDAAINPGNSGGPLLNMKGHVIGMNTAIYSRSGASAGIGFSVPSNLVRKIAEQLISSGSVSRGYLGVQLAQDLDEDLIQALNLPKNAKGALISRVEPSTPADEAGLESGDVIFKVNNTTIRSRQDLTNSIGLLNPGTKIDIGYYRNGKTQKTKLTLSAFPGAQSVAQQESQQEENTLAGLKLESLNPSVHADWIQQFNIESKRGLLVMGVEPGSAAASAGIRRGDVLLEANRTQLAKPQDFASSFRKSSRLLIQLERSGTYLYASLRK